MTLVFPGFLEEFPGKILAERGRFELPGPEGPTVFETAAFNRSATSPLKFSREFIVPEYPEFLYNFPSGPLTRNRKIVTNVQYVVEYKSIFQLKDSVMSEFVSTEKAGDVTVVRFSFNEISRDQREQIKQDLQKLMDAGERKFIIDLTKVGFISSLVIATIIFFAKQVKENGGAIKISGLSSEAFSIFQLTQLDKILDLYESETDALENF